MDCVLQAAGLTKRYHGTPALDGLNLELPAGKIIGLLGPNGSGKTTFIKIAAGLLTPTAGSVTIGFLLLLLLAWAFPMALASLFAGTKS